ncbi:MAG TPA: hypothetical protein VH328_06950, partial [Burkholderiaceae bacterium]|nr:hypothetical protein [Burkholderiaceae bacterium]
FTLAQLTARGTVDARFAEWAREAPFPIEVIPSSALDRVRDGLLGVPSVLPPAFDPMLQHAVARRSAPAVRARRKLPPA